MKQARPTSKERVLHIIRAIRLIQDYCGEHTLQSFLNDRKTIDACLYQYGVIGEGTAQLDEAILEKYRYPWHKVKSFRNIASHEYHAVEMRVIWDTNTEILPALREMMEKIYIKEF